MNGNRICVICGKRLSNHVCLKCGYDDTCNYDYYRTLYCIGENKQSCFRQKDNMIYTNIFDKMKQINPTLQCVLASEAKLEDAIRQLIREEILSEVNKNVEIMVKKEVEKYNKMESVHNVIPDNKSEGEKKNSEDNKQISLVFSKEKHNGFPVVGFGLNKTKWLMIKREGNRILLLSKDTVNKMKYSTNRETDWGKSDVRIWLNNAFYQSYFSDVDKKLIEKTKNNTLYRNGKEIQTVDYLFLLSEEEIVEYLPSDMSRIIVSNDVNEKTKKSEMYWLRSEGIFGSLVKMVNARTGAISMGGLGDQEELVRPAMWIDLSSLGGIEIEKMLDYLCQK